MSEYLTEPHAAIKDCDCRECAIFERDNLRKALDTIARVSLASRTQTLRHKWIFERAKSALNGDDNWKKMKQPKGYYHSIDC